MNKLLDILSMVGSFLVVFGILFILQDLTIGNINFVKSLIIFKILPFKYLIFTATSLIFILNFIDFYIPNRNKS